MYERKDHYYKKAKEEGRASRAVYKLEQIQARYKVIRKGDRVLDLGAAPGGWMEVVSEWVGPQGLVAGIDLLPPKIKLRQNMRFILGDINKGDALSQLAESLGSIEPSHGKADVVLSDMAPNTSGVRFRDSCLSYELCLMALDVTKALLRTGGNFVAKIFQGEDVESFKKDLRGLFVKVEHYVPPATREGSKELYLVAKGFKGQ